MPCFYLTPKQDDSNQELQICIAEALCDVDSIVADPGAYTREQLATLQEIPNVTCRTWFLAVMLMWLSVGMVPTASGLEPSLGIERWYMGGGFGRSDDKGLREDDTGFKVFGGYRASKYLALEGAIVFLGEFGPANAFSKDGLSLEFVGILPIGQRFQLFGKLGLFSWEIRRSVIFFDDDGTDATYGVGFQTHFTGRWGGRLEWQRFTDVGTDDVDLLSVNVIYGF